MSKSITHFTFFWSLIFIFSFSSSNFSNFF
ncbi:hypothetical protein CoNPh17_CDS0238 [Staphylococcus phage S-CoN_Ph17]|nr:hypothetical protein CoNPh17_CDS0238 [Staphylococcus phage S-CoN_Ph17]